MIDTILRWLVQWKARRRAAQIIVFDGGAEIDRARSFARGAVTGIVLSFTVVALSAPSPADPTLVGELDHKESLIQESRERADQAVALAQSCLNTAAGMQRTVESYQQLLRRR
ncbi:MAG: hypothetical protein M3409_12040 [Gemmatimonadota bacterium]|nr:hypothetical protein [Gemmatimonadota bacterium]